MTTENQNGSAEIEVEKIINDIRMQILAQKIKETGQQTSAVLEGNYFSSDFYERIYQASVTKQELLLQVNQSNVPIVGGLIDRLRTMVHQLIVFYLNQFVAEQARVNDLTINLIKEMSAEIEKLGKQVAEQNGESPAE